MAGKSQIYLPRTQDREYPCYFPLVKRPLLDTVEVVPGPLPFRFCSPVHARKLGQFLHPGRALVGEREGLVVMHRHDDIAVILRQRQIRKGGDRLGG